MQKIPHRRGLLCAAISLSLLPLASPTFAQDDTVEEVVVTGSFIRRTEGFTGASSIVQLNAEDLEAEGTLNIGEVVQNLSFVNGSASAITNTIQGQDSRSTSIDLRGLGARSTLTLLDGKRLVNENVNALIPTIAIQRLDIVADGAAALYGNEAVAGVVNFVPYKSYDGFKLDTYAEQDSQGDYDEHSVQMLWGGQLGEIDLVLAGQFRQNSRLGWDERSDLANAGLIMSSNAPGNWYVPDRDAAGAYTGTQSRRPDPNCAPASERTAYTPNQVNAPYGMLLGNTCFFDFGDNRSYREPTQTNQFFANATWEASDDLTLELQAFSTRLAEVTYTSTSNPGNSRIGELPGVRGEIPGNPFFATDSTGAQLYGVDNNGDGVPDRGTADINNDGWGDYIVSGTTDNGVLLHEDVAPRTLRPINKTHTRSSGHSADRDNVAGNTDHISRYSLTADFTVPFIDGWEGTASWTHNYREIKFMSNQNYDITAMQQGLNCDTVNDRDACYNPFFVVDQADNNSIHVMNDIAARDKEVVEDKLDVIDIVLNGEVPLGGFELPGGPIAAAVGYQWRDDKFTNVPSAVELAGDTWIGGTEKETVVSGSREVDAYFLELSIPVLPSLEVEAAVRQEEFSTGQKSTDPKFGVTWAATDWLSLRATTGDAFIAPTLEQLLNPVTCGLSTVTDRFGPFSAFTTACGGGNPSLQNETATSTQFGVDIALGDFDIHVTWNETEFQNRIIGINGQDLMELEFANFKAATGFTGSGLTGDQPTEAQLISWLGSGGSNPDIIRDPNDIYTILQVDNTSTTNAESVQVTAFDIEANYRFSLDNWGDFRIGLQATNVDEFLYQEDPTQAVKDGAGKYNANTSAAPELPEWKANLRMGWTMGQHSVTSTAHYISDLPYDGPMFTHMDFFGGTNRPAGITDVAAWADMDLAYTYRGIELFDGEAAFTVGSRNVFDRKAQRSPEFAGVIGALQDPLGRVLYARFVYDF
ncbi:MAG: TonB-dependent receptor [Gammaproteobacteria bacterium]|jgi:outer membrane receptor protein involved in Fe transport|nr:TonB-dependent receptor [Gammaproteobacteria bacterium]MBT3861012.1 TonB-dependent receptor [Gammaproteobacteria bacterium]MBT3986231.1 TonB-dependent receptor [Gammaproteobacteria bacterium]MBT4256514.1 TonB-dependent receptor [Gammaproteobacteria bacterium]MBT4581553.1 TonB-dependent receptor [Gammaproteobacteria bacterium]